MVTSYPFKIRYFVPHPGGLDFAITPHSPDVVLEFEGVERAEAQDGDPRVSYVLQSVFLCFRQRDLRTPVSLCEPETQFSHSTNRVG